METGRRVARRLIAPDVLDTIPLSADISLNEQIVPKALVGKTIEELDLEKRLRLRLVGILRMTIDLDDSGNGVRRENLLLPEGSARLEEADRLFLLGTNADLALFREI